MKTFNIKYSDFNEFIEFCNINNIIDNDKLLIQLFSGVIDTNILQNISDDILALLPNATLIGTTTSGEIMGANVFDNSIVISLTQFETTSIQSAKAVLKNNNSYQCGLDIINKFSDTTKAIITFGSGLTLNGEEYLHGINSMRNNITIAGGLSGDNGIFKKTILILNGKLFVEEEEEEEEVRAVAIGLSGDELLIYKNYTLNWQPIGKWLKVTKSNKNRVYEIDGMTPVDIYRKYLGDDVAKLLPQLGVNFPLMIHKHNTDIARAVLVRHDDDSLSFGGNIPEGTMVRFAYGNISMILNNSQKHIYECCNGHKIESIFVYSCMARKGLLQSKAYLEIEPLANIASVSGFYTYGEFFTDNNSCKFLNETMTILSMSESDIKVDIKKTNIDIDHNDADIMLIKALSHLVDVSVEDMEKQNEIMFAQSQQAAMGEMVGNIAHQWRQPLASLSMILQSYKHAFLADKLDEEFIDKQTIQAKDVAKHMSQTIDDFRNFFKPNKNKEIFDIIKSIQKVLAILDATLKNKDIEVKINNKESILNVHGFENEFSQAIINILNNAKDELIKKDKNRLIEIDTKIIKDNIIVSISDNAGGIADDIMPKIFEPYFTTKHQSSGTGIGLYMTKQIIESHMDGKLLAYNNTDGAVFEIILKKE
jgi:signal transduction histidine kinase